MMRVRPKIHGPEFRGQTVNGYFSELSYPYIFQKAEFRGLEIPVRVFSVLDNSICLWFDISNWTKDIWNKAFCFMVLLLIAYF